jgi:hypothetical protein
MVERLHIADVLVAGATDAAATETGSKVDMGRSQRALFLLVGNGGTVELQLQEGELTSAVNATTGEVTATGIEWGNLQWSGVTATNGSTGTVDASGEATSGQLQEIEVRSESMSAGHQYLRAITTTGDADVYSSVVALLDCSRYTPEDDDDAVKTPVVIGANPFA